MTQSIFFLTNLKLNIYCPICTASFGPPLVSVEIEDNNAIITLMGPMRYQPDNHSPAISMATLYPQMTYNLSIENRGTTVSTNIHYRSKVWGHPDNFVFSMKTHTFIYKMNCKMNREYS